MIYLSHPFLRGNWLPGNNSPNNPAASKWITVLTSGLSMTHSKSIGFKDHYPDLIIDPCLLKKIFHQGLFVVIRHDNESAGIFCNDNKCAQFFGLFTAAAIHNNSAAIYILRERFLLSFFTLLSTQKLLYDTLGLSNDCSENIAIFKKHISL